MDLALASVAEISHWPGQLILQGLARYRGFGPAYICGAVGCAAFVGLTTYSIVYVGLCAGDAESKLLEDLRARTADVTSWVASILYVKKRFIIHDLQEVAR